MSEVRKTPVFQKWLEGLKDDRAYARIETPFSAWPLGSAAT